MRYSTYGVAQWCRGTYGDAVCASSGVALNEVATSNKAPAARIGARMWPRLSGRATGLEDVVDRDGACREQQRAERIAAPESVNLTVPLEPRLPMHLDHVGREIYQPGFSNARAGVQRKLDVAVGSSRSVRDFDHQENISGSRMRRPIAVGPRPEQRDIGVGFPPCPQDQRILHPNDSGVSVPCGEC